MDDSTGDQRRQVTRGLREGERKIIITFYDWLEKEITQGEKGLTEGNKCY